MKGNGVLIPVIGRMRDLTTLPQQQNSVMRRYCQSFRSQDFSNAPCVLRKTERAYSRRKHIMTHYKAFRILCRLQAGTTVAGLAGTCSWRPRRSCYSLNGLAP